MMNKKVSIVIPCYNQGRYVFEAIDSALAQTYNNIEIVIVNDGSSDNSSEVIKSYADKYKNILFFDNRENNGVIYARNMAIKAASGEYILPLDADDIIEPTYIEKAVKVLDENPKIGIVYCKARFFGSKNKYWNLNDFDKSDILYGNLIFCSALFRKSDFLKVGMYKDYMPYGWEDYDLWLSFVEHGFDVYRIDEILFNYRQYDEDSRSTICSQNQDNIRKALVKNHINMYLEDEQFLDRLLTNPKVLKRKYKKYKKMFNNTLVISVVIFIIQMIIIGVLYSR